jgi:hypothetical protein
LISTTPTSRHGKENLDTPPGLNPLASDLFKEERNRPIVKSKSQPKVTSTKSRFFFRGGAGKILTAEILQSSRGNAYLL